MKMSPRLMRFILNIYPPYLGAGVKVHKIAENWKFTEVSMPLRWYNRNAVRTHFGGSLYSMVDPHLMLMLMGILGENYIVWDKAAQIEFVRPGQGRVSARLEISDEKLSEILATLESKRKVTPTFLVEVVDNNAKTVAKIMKTLYVRKKH